MITKKKSAIAIATLLTVTLLGVVTMLFGVAESYQRRLISLEKFESERLFYSLFAVAGIVDLDINRVFQKEGVETIALYITEPGKERLVASYGGDPPPVDEVSKIDYHGIEGYSQMNVDWRKGRLEYFAPVRDTGPTMAWRSVTDNDVSFLNFSEIAYIVRYNPSLARTRMSLVLFRIVGVLFYFILEYGIVRTMIQNQHLIVENQRREEDAALGASARTIVHEIKNPLHSISIQAKILEKTCPQEAETIAIIKEEIERVSSLSTRVGDFLSAGSGNDDRIPIVSFVKDEVHKFGSNVELNVKDDLSSVHVIFDTSHLKSIIDNLIKNAEEALSEAPLEPEEKIIRLDIYRQGGSVYLDLFDNGPAFPEKESERANLLKPFITTKYHGNGIGLALAQRFVSQRSGSLELINPKGGGALVRLILPVAK